MTNPLVSIIVPVYNAQKGLSRCLESICSQTYQELEIIVLNDGSTDDSLAICEQFRAKDPASWWWIRRTKVFPHAECRAYPCAGRLYPVCGQ